LSGFCHLFSISENLVEHDLDVVASVPVADALPRVLAARQVSPTVLSSSLFRHERSLRGKFGGVNSAFTSFRRGQQRAAFPVLPVGSRRKSARGLAQSKTLREVRKPLANASASWTAMALYRFRFKVQQIAFLRAGFEDDRASVF